jgi:hypothetical protein
MHVAPFIDMLFLFALLVMICVAFFCRFRLLVRLHNVVLTRFCLLIIWLLLVDVGIVLLVVVVTRRVVTVLEFVLVFNLLCDLVCIPRCVHL